MGAFEESQRYLNGTCYQCQSSHVVEGSCQKDLDRNIMRRSASAVEFGGVGGIDRASYCCGTDLLVPCINACISSCVSRPSLLLSIALKIRS
jgi:hypothetical protein